MHFIFYLRCLCPNFHLKHYLYVCVCSVVSDSLQSHVACQPPLSVEFSRQKYWSGLPFPPPGDISHPGIELVSVVSCIIRQILYCWASWEAQWIVHNMDLYNLKDDKTANSSAATTGLRNRTSSTPGSFHQHLSTSSAMNSWILS